MPLMFQVSPWPCPAMCVKALILMNGPAKTVVKKVMVTRPWTNGELTVPSLQSCRFVRTYSFSWVAVAKKIGEISEELQR